LDFAADFHFVRDMIGTRSGHRRIDGPWNWHFISLDARYERVRQPARERHLLASVAEAGQQMPIVGRDAGSAWWSHKRVRCLRVLRRDTVAAVILRVTDDAPCALVRPDASRRRR
jgi:hypothetical protein